MSKEPLPSNLLEQLRAIVDELGEVGAAERIGVARNTIVRAIAGRPLYRGTRVLIGARLGGAA